jgi:hypothetical protein
MAKRNPSAPAGDEPASQSPESPPTNGGDATPTRGSPPVWKKRLYSNGSSIECAVFRNLVEQGQTSFATYSVTLQRSYKEADNTWKETRSLRRDDLLVAAHVLQRAYAWITEQEQT